MNTIEQKKQRVYSFIINQMMIGVPKKQLRENLAYWLESDMGLEMMKALELTELIFNDKKLWSNMKTYAENKLKGA